MKNKKMKNIKKVLVGLSVFSIGFCALDNIEQVNAYSTKEFSKVTTQGINQIHHLMNIKKVTGHFWGTTKIIDNSILYTLKPGKKYKFSFSMTMDKYYSKYLPDGLSPEDYMRKGIGIYSSKLKKGFYDVDQWSGSTIYRQKMQIGETIHLEGTFIANEELVNPDNEYRFIFYTQLMRNEDGSYNSDGSLTSCTSCDMTFENISLIQLN